MNDLWSNLVKWVVPKPSNDGPDPMEQAKRTLVVGNVTLCTYHSDLNLCEEWRYRKPFLELCEFLEVKEVELITADGRPKGLGGYALMSARVPATAAQLNQFALCAGFQSFYRSQNQFTERIGYEATTLRTVFLTSKRIRVTNSWVRSGNIKIAHSITQSIRRGRNTFDREAWESAASAQLPKHLKCCMESITPILTTGTPNEKYLKAVRYFSQA